MVTKNVPVASPERGRPIFSGLARTGPSGYARCVAVIRFRDSGRTLPVGKLLCLGHNYREHAREMGSPEEELPVVFLKPASAVIHDGGEVVIPEFSQEAHHEVELVVVIGEGGKHIPEAEAFSRVAGYAVGLDMTLRDVQAKAKRAGHPWTIAKGFDTSAPLSLAVERSRVSDPHALEMTLRVNGAMRQHASTSEMIFHIDRTLAYLSTIFTLEPGDLVFTGTPAGVGRVVSGDVLEAEITEVGTLTVRVR
jgi:2-keto-4-pentenoate hydratase/2-oxohepta-3-ene-1,7-dioic acid hydratase in catechol pathway